MKKKIFAVAAAGAMTAATAVPALALENEFHGMFRVFGTISNYGSTNASGSTIAGVLTPDLSSDAPTRGYMEQRARLMYIAKANDDLKLVTHFEIDSRWGDNAYNSNNTTRNNGGAIGADQTNLETKNVYLDFNIPSTPLNFKVGIQPWVDSYGGILVNADMAGALATAKYAGFTNSLGWFRFNEDAGSLPGKATRDFMILDTKYNLSKDIRIGGSYYLLTDDRAASDNTYTHMIGVNADMKFDPVTVGAFGMYQFGDTPSTVNSDLSAFLVGTTAKAKVGIGTVKLAALYVSGEQNANTDSSAFQPINSESSFYAADMQIMLRNKWNVNNDRSLVQNISNFYGAFVGYDANITDKLFANVNAGFGFAAQTAGKGTAAEPDSSYRGTELNAEVGYKLFDNMTVMAQGAYFILGDFYQKTKGGVDNNLDDPYQARLMVNYAF
ncbi:MULTISPECIES: hypothetical protein [Geobacter]|uniref:Porin n=2 Tax=Geobacter TaxID=28231 RepID=A0A0C1QRQ7_9BACT|nr:MULTISPECIES: hypothetical protein [Geobacter]KIE43582.1 hypothetical protein SE37_13550 [Geobacter soli]MBE2889293.1 histidine kinase [Geobacter anodireducens]HMN03650.1 histidine kinase [Geobacter anodireducens]